jgi:hypothetical protein
MRRWVIGAMLMLLAGGAAAQSGGTNRPSPRPAGPNGLPPLQTEAGDIWSEVRGWDDQHRRRFSRPAAPPAREAPARQRQPRPPGQPQPQVQPRP